MLMTLSKRNGFFKAGILLSIAALGGMIAVLVSVIPAYPAAMEEASRRSSGLVQGLTDRFFQPAPYAPLASSAAAVIYALVSLILIYYFFEQTNAPEILFVALFVFSFAFEGIRLMIPLKRLYELPGIYLMMGFRTLLFARYFGLFALFAGSVCAAGLELQKQRHMLLVISAAALVIALGLPIDVMTWDSSLFMLSGYGSMFRMVETAIVLITVVSFLISAYSRGSKEYILVGAGSLLALLGRNILLSADTWLNPPPGLFLLALGTWLICARLHRIYLWL
jgi:hypothetical protein